MEASELQRAELELEEIIVYDQTFSAEDICNFHEFGLAIFILSQVNIEL